MICHSPKAEDVGKTFILQEKSLGKDSIKPTEDDKVSQEKSLVPDPGGKEASSKITTSNTSSSLTGYDGLINLAQMLGVVVLIKLLLGHSVTIAEEAPPLVTMIPIIPTPPLSILVFPGVAMLLAYRVELLLSQHKVSWDNALPCHLATLSMCLAIPVLVIKRQDTLDGLLFNLLVCLSYIILTMKLNSYIQVNKMYREKLATSNNNETLCYPENLSLGSIIRFWLAPTLVYQPNEGRSPSLNVWVVIKRFVELSVLQVVIRQGMLTMPSIVSGLVEAVHNDNILLIIERFLTLSLAFNLVWMLSSYLLFVSFLQLLAEITQAQERIFFHSWWNASSMEEFWRWWNLPVHRWCVKHIYVPLVKNGFSKLNAMLAVFITSALLHEYLLSCPIQITGHFAFIAFLGQLPLIKITKAVKTKCGGRVGNLLVWVVLVFGNTVGVVVYYKEVV